MQRFGSVDKDTPHVKNTDEFHNWASFWTHCKAEDGKVSMLSGV